MNLIKFAITSLYPKPVTAACAVDSFSWDKPCMCTIDICGLGRRSVHSMLASIRSPSEAVYMLLPVLCRFCCLPCNINHMTTPNQFRPLFGKAKTCSLEARNKVAHCFRHGSASRHSWYPTVINILMLIFHRWPGDVVTRASQQMVGDDEE